MQAFTVHRGIAAPLDRANVDTDAIIPKQYLKSIKRTGFGPNAFDDWRYLDPGQPDADNTGRRPNPDVVVVHPCGPEAERGDLDVACGDGSHTARFADAGQKRSAGGPGCRFGFAHAPQSNVGRTTSFG